MKIKDDFILREIAGRYVIIPTGGTGLSLRKIYEINEAGAFLFRQLSEKEGGQDMSRDMLIKALADEYEIPEDLAAKDAGAFIDYLFGIEALEGEGQ